MCDSEIIATSAKGAMNTYFMKSNIGEIYIPKSKWDDYDINYPDNYDFDNSDNDIDDSYEIVNSDMIIPYRSEIEYEITYDYVLISDLRIKIKLNHYDIGNNYMNKLLHINLYFYVCGSIVSAFTMEINLLLANILEKNKKELDEFIELPIVFFDLEKNKFSNKFPLFLMDHSNIKIKIDNLDEIADNGIIITYKKYNYKKLIITDIINILEFVIIQIQFHSERFKNIGSIYRLPFNGICKMLIIKFFGINTLEDNIRRIKITLAENSSPIIWDYDKIIRYNMYGNIYYCIPLSPEIQSKKGTKKLLSNKNENGYGINFSRIDQPKISFDYYYNNFYCDCLEITALNLNILRCLGGLAGPVHSVY